MSGSRTIIAEEDRLDNVHPGNILREDFQVGSGISLDEVAAGSGVSTVRLKAIITGKHAVDVETGLRLSRYFGMSDGFFVGLQLDHDVEEAQRTRGDALDRIVPRAA